MLTCSRPFVGVCLVATIMKSIALVQSGLISVLLEPKGATQEARFSSYCRLLPPRPTATLLEGNEVTGAGDGNRTHLRSLGRSSHKRVRSIPDCRSDYSAEDRSINPVASPTFRFAKSFSVISTCSLYSPRHSPSGIAVAMLFKIELSLRRILLNLPDNRSSNHSRHFILRCPHVSPAFLNFSQTSSLISRRLLTTRSAASLKPDFRTLDIVQKAKRGELRDYMKTKNAESKHGRVVDLPVALATLLCEFVAARRSGLVFCKDDSSQLMQRDILKYSLHPILKKLGLEQGGLNIFRRFRITAMETAEVPQALQHTWSGHARTHVSEIYKKLLKQREWRLGWAERAGMGFSLPERKNPRNAQLAQLIKFRKVG